MSENDVCVLVKGISYGEESTACECDLENNPCDSESMAYGCDLENNPCDLEKTACGCDLENNPCGLECTEVCLGNIVGE